MYTTGLDFILFNYDSHSLSCLYIHQRHPVIPKIFSEELIKNEQIKKNPMCCNTNYTALTAGASKASGNF